MVCMSSREENPNAFKLLINQQVLEKYFSDFLSRAQIQALNKQMSNLELKDRVRFVATHLNEHLSADYVKALQELLKITHTQNMNGFELWPATEFIQKYGLSHIGESLQAMYELTPRFTAEFSIRPFINQYGKDIYSRLSSWKSDPNEHIRRWLSEGTRPRLPWGEKLAGAIKDPKLGLDILEDLKFDSSLYVRKSVANHLNDITKDHPDLVIATLQRWSKQVPATYKKEFQFIVHRALRTMIKNGHPKALVLIGVQANAKTFKISKFKIGPEKLRVGQSLEMNFEIENLTSKKQKFVVDFVIYFQKSNGALSPKVFKLKSGFLEARQKMKVVKKQSFKKVTTRKFYPGLHKVSLKINGSEQKALSFHLKA